MELTCPSCRSENTQRLSVVYETGINNIHARTGGVGVGVGRGGLSVGVGTASTAGTTQTAMSQRAAPPERKPYLKPLLKIFGAYFLVTLFISGVGSLALGAAATLAWLGGSVAWIYFAAKYNAKTWVTANAIWQSSFLCHRCSHMFVPISD